MDNNFKYIVSKVPEDKYLCREISFNVYLLVKITISISFFFIFLTGFSQVKPNSIRPHIKVLARNFLDSVAIRWAPDKPSAWKVLNSYGYILERRTVYKDKKFIISKPEIKKLSVSPIKPFTKNQFEAAGDTSNDVLLVYQAIYGESFQLNTSEGDVGPVALINKAKELDNRFSFALFSADHSPKAAKMHGLWFTDRDVRPGEKYVYRVYSAVPDSVMKIDSGFVYVDLADTFIVPKPYDVHVDFRNHAAVVSWNREFFENIFITYLVERSDDDGKSFHSIKDLPVINPYREPDKKPLRNIMVDSLPINNFTYQYRVRGVTPFGEISLPSDVVGGSGYETGEMLNPDIIKYDVTPDNKKVALKWKVGSDSVFVKGFDVYRAKKNDGPYRKLNDQPLSAQTRIFIDTLPEAVNYYRVNSFDAKMRLFPSFTTMVQLIDSTPPVPPKNLKGFIDSSGLVHLSWDKNTELDFASYCVFKANNPKAEFAKVNQEAVLANNFMDTTILKTLSSYIYYRLTALDQHYNQSEYSETLKLKRPDIVPPAAPVFTGYATSDTAVILNFVPSPSDDVIKLVLYRQRIDEPKAILIATLDSSKHDSVFYDISVKGGASYKYILLAVDDAGLESEKTVVNLKVPVKTCKPAVEAVACKVNYEESAIELNWNYNFDGVEHFLIYRSDHNKGLSRYRSAAPEEKRFIDKGIRKENVYGYSVQAIFKDGSRSKMSEEVKVNY